MTDPRDLLDAARTEREAFLKAICDNPDDDTPRLVYADWLTEHGEEPLAEFVRRQVAGELAMPRLAWLVPFQELFGCHPHQLRRVAEDGVAWADCPSTGKRITFRRGFVHSVTCSGDDWARHGDAVLREHPVREVVVTELREVWLIGPGGEREPADSAGGWGLAPDPEQRLFDAAEIEWHGDSFALAIMRLRWPGVTFRPAE